MRNERIEQERTYQDYSDEWLIDRYFRFGSVEDALYRGSSSIPFSFADYHRKLEKFGIVKSAGRHTSLSEALHFFRIKQMEPGAPLESIYKTMPPSFQTSIATLHRIYNRVLETKQKAVATRYATALTLSKAQNANEVLIGTELFSETKYGKIAGQATIPMTFSRNSDTPFQRIIRVLQQEVLTEEAIHKKFVDKEYVNHLLQNVRGPFLKYRLLDVEISCYALTLPTDIHHFSSFKLTNHQFVHQSDVSNESTLRYRIGIPEIVRQSFVPKQLTDTDEVINSDFNIALSTEEDPNQKLALRYSK
jgi:hypothetical protein